MGAYKAGMNTDGDILLQKAVLTCCRGNGPRDGGTAIGVLGDWIAERLADSPYVAVMDTEATGAALLITRGVNSVGDSAYIVAMIDPTEELIDTYSIQDLGKDFKEYFAKQAGWFWREGGQS